jgi:cation diffusion facilitator CzcD-associated flavoprotein CzcO
MSEITLPTKYAIVGAGPAGLVSARAFMRYGIEVDVLERFSKPGGIWNIDQAGSPMYKSCNFISSSAFGGFIGAPMPKSYPAYPKWNQVRDYIHQFVTDFGIEERIQYNTSVVLAEPVESEVGRYWRVTLESGEVRNYRGVVIASGQNWVPFIPPVPGLDTFTGRSIHSSEYTETSEFAGKRVLVVGAGNSGVDIAADAAFFGEEAYLSTRRGYWFLPKVLYGQPVPDLLAGNIVPTEGPLAGLEFPELVEAVLSPLGNPADYGLPAPDHDFGASHPIVNQQVLHCLAHGMLEWRPDLHHIDGNIVHFVDGSSQELDVIVFATGYDVHIPWLPDGVLSYHDGHPEFVMGTLVEGQPGLYSAGELHFAGNTFSIFDRTIQLAAAEAHADLTGENADNIARLRAGYRPNLKGDFGFLETRRNVNQVFIPELEAMYETWETEYGIPVPKFSDVDFYAPLLKVAQPA